MINIIPSGQACGATVTGIDLSQELSTEMIAEIRAAWLEHHVLAFPDQQMDDDALERYTLQFGGFGDDPFISPIEGRDHIVAIQRGAEETTPIFAEAWHTDWNTLVAMDIKTLISTNSWRSMVKMVHAGRANRGYVYHY